MWKFFEHASLIRDSDGKIRTGIKVRPSEDGDGYFATSMDEILSAFITDATYGALVAGEVVTIHS